MDWNSVEGNWKEVKGKVKEKWAKLTDDDLTAIDGQRPARRSAAKAVRLRQGSSSQRRRHVVLDIEVSSRANGPAEMSLPVSPPARRVFAAMVFGGRRRTLV
jgi:hypothetical protein